MEKDARYFIVGLVVSIGMIALVGFVLWLAGTHKSQDREIYTVYFTDPVSGLKEGASVQYRGVEVGKVLAVRLSHSREDLIKVDIAVKESTPIGESTTALLEMFGITGLVYMELTTEPGETRPPQRIPGEQYPVITGSGTQLARIIEDIPMITQQVLEVVEKLNEFFDPKHTALLSQTLENTERLSRDLNGLLTSENVNNASTTIENFSQASEDFKTMAERFDQTASEIERAVASLNEIISGNKNNINRFTSEGLDNITKTSREAEKAAKAIREMSEKLNRDPSQIIYKPQSSGVEIEK
jgi:phospholipid/cholesterol/gamma-HCH transport system substrate-binding protein